MTRQEQADSARALLIIQELIDAGLITIQGVIDPQKCRETLKELKRQGVSPNENRAADRAEVYSIDLGVRLTGRRPA